jgi:hypothetical protein
MAKTWDEIRAFRYSTVAPPPGWPDNVRPISIDGVTLFGIDPATNKLYWDGREIVVRDRLRLGGWANFLAILVAIGTFRVVHRGAWQRAQLVSRITENQMIWLLTRCRGWFWELMFWLLVLELARVIGG